MRVLPVVSVGTGSMAQSVTTTIEATYGTVIVVPTSGDLIADSGLRVRAGEALIVDVGETIELRADGAWVTTTEVEFRGHVPFG